MAARGAFRTESVTTKESLLEVACRHIRGTELNQISAASRDTFEQWGLCDKHEGVLVNRESDPGQRNPECMNCSRDNPRMKLATPLRQWTDLVPLRRAWKEAWDRLEAMRKEIGKMDFHNDDDTVNKREDRVRQLRNDPVEVRAWIQYWLGAWQARNKVVDMLASGRPWLEGTKFCQTFIREFVDDWQLRHPEVTHAAREVDESSGPRPHMECTMHKRPGVMFPFADDADSYNPACWICIKPRVRAAVLSAEVSESDFDSLCGITGKGTRAVVNRAQASAAASQAYNESSMYDDEEEKGSEM